VILPGYDVLLAFRACKLFEHTRIIHEPDQFAALAVAADVRGIGDTCSNHALFLTGDEDLTGAGSAVADDNADWWAASTSHRRASSTPARRSNVLFCRCDTRLHDASELADRRAELGFGRVSFGCVLDARPRSDVRCW
jgi:hypothetical protein